MFWKFSTLAAALIVASSAAQALTIAYDEGVSGDALPSAPTGVIGVNEPLNPNTALGAVLPGSNLVLGSVEGSGVDDFDVFSFTVNRAWSLDILSYSPGANNTSTRFRLHASSALTLSDALLAPVITGPSADIFSGYNSAGSYMLSISESNSTSPAAYSLSINVAPVPIPASLPLAVAAFGGLGLMARRRRR